eukprot:Phypoly_transcript_08247.p1 GENE.Phypoly_transcript_08247~~Phypoly_transcript_08247.p1  ORF type:complete len:269 (+),score=27.75 Phypoly_transcript_08247:699-1505(+)
MNILLLHVYRQVRLKSLNIQRSHACLVSGIHCAAYSSFSSPPSSNQQSSPKSIPTTSSPSFPSLSPSSSSTPATNGATEDSATHNSKVVPWYLSWFVRENTKVLQINNVYQNAVDQAEHVLTETGIERNFNTWYAMVVLHLWMLFVRLRRDGQAGQALAQDLFDNFWRDSETRMIQMKISNPITLSRATKFYARVYYGSVVAYDESLNPVHSDMILADALWRNLFGTADTAANQLEKMVVYVHREMNALDSLPDIVLCGKVMWGHPVK